MTTAKEAKLIGELLRERREELGQYQTNAADTIGVSRNNYRQWETGHAIPSDKWIGPLMDYLDMAENDLVMTLSRSRRARGGHGIHVMSGGNVILLPTLRGRRTTDWDGRPIEIYGENEILPAA